jgi:hypothetical protein
MIQIRQPKHSATVIRLDLCLPMATASHAAAFGTTGAGWTLQKRVALRSGLGVLSANVCLKQLTVALKALRC